MVNEGLGGVTSNPTIFDKAISGSADYDEQIQELLHADPQMTTDAILRSLMMRDIQMAAIRYGRCISVRIPMMDMSVWRLLRQRP